MLFDYVQFNYSTTKLRIILIKMGKNCQDIVEKKKSNRVRKKGSKNKPKQAPLGDLTNKIGKYSFRTRSQPQETKKTFSIANFIKEKNGRTYLLNLYVIR